MILVFLFSISFAFANELIFQRTLELSHNKISVDRKPFERLICPQGDLKPYGKIKTPLFQIPMNCQGDYPSGFSVEKFILGSLNSDAGQEWETQSHFLWDEKEMKLYLKQIHYSLYDQRVEIEGMPRETLLKQGWTDKKLQEVKANPWTCKKTFKSFEWKQEKRKFVSAWLPKTFPKTQLQPFPSYVKKCMKK